jgi:hypothetical protein
MAGCNTTCSFTGEEVLADVSDHGERTGKSHWVGKTTYGLPQFQPFNSGTGRITESGNPLEGPNSGIDER